MIDDEKIELVIIDDDDLVVELIRRLLRDEECNIRGFTNQEECLAYLAKTSPTYLFVDMRMPRIDGLEFLTMLRTQGIIQNTKIYLCSGALPPDNVLSQLSKMEVEVIEKDSVCNKKWLRSTLGFDN